MAKRGYDGGQCRADASASVGNGGNGNHVNITNESANEEPNPFALAKETISIMGMTVGNKVDDVGKAMSSAFFKFACILTLLTAFSALSLGMVLFSKIDRFETVFYESSAAQIKVLKSLISGANNAVQGQ